LSQPGADRQPVHPGVFCALLVAWIVLEYARPPNPLKIPLIASSALFLGWLATPRKLWDPQIFCLLAFFSLTVIAIPLAENNYSSYQVANAMLISIVTVAIPMAHFADTVRRVDLLAKALLVVLAYMGIWAIGHGGLGPAAEGGAQDENYVAMYMSVALPFAYFAVFHFNGLHRKLVYTGLVGIFVVAIIVSLSRGGFLGLVAVAFFCWLRSPRKLLGVVVAIVMGVVTLVVASDKYWSEMETIADTNEGTADLRIDAWKIAFRQYLDNPILGVGGGNFPWEMGKYQGSDMWNKYGRNMSANMVTHSLYFELLAEEGSCGAILVAMLIYFTIRDLRWVERNARRRQRALGPRSPAAGEITRATWLALSLQGGMIGFLVCSAFISTLYMSTFWTLVGMSLALRHATARSLRATDALRQPQPASLAAPSLPQAAPGRSGGRLAELL
jgi:O-antigen ligase